MIFVDENFTIDTSSRGAAKVVGVLRLSSPAEYEARFEPLKKGLSDSESYTIDLSGVRFMNSSGITSLSRLVLAARAQDKPLTLIGSETVAWHNKTLMLLRRLYDRLDVHFQ